MIICLNRRMIICLNSFLSLTDECSSSIWTWFDYTTERNWETIRRISELREIWIMSTYFIRPSVMFASSLTGAPDSSIGGEISKDDSIEHTIAQSERLAKNCPGQILSQMVCLNNWSDRLNISPLTCDHIRKQLWDHGYLDLASRSWGIGRVGTPQVQDTSPDRAR